MQTGRHAFAARALNLQPDLLPASKLPRVLDKAVAELIPDELQYGSNQTRNRINMVHPSQDAPTCHPWP